MQTPFSYPTPLRNVTNAQSIVGRQKFENKIARNSFRYNFLVVI